jgi:hypothetical protein
MAPCFGWDSFWGVITQRLCLLSSDGRWNTVYASWTSVLFDRSLVRSKWNTTRSPCCGFCFTFRLQWIETQSYAMIYAPILGDELVLAFAEARRWSPRAAPWRRRLAPQRHRAVSFFPFFSAIGDWNRGATPGGGDRRREGALKPGSNHGRTIGLKSRRNYLVGLDFNGDKLLCIFYWMHNGYRLSAEMFYLGNIDCFIIVEIRLVSY